MKTKYAAELAEQWSQLYPDKPFTGKHLLAQIKNIKNRKLLAPDEIDRLKSEVLAQSPTARLTNIRRSIRGSMNTPRPRMRSLTEETERVEPITTFDDAAREILTVFEEASLKWTGIAIDRRPRITRLKQNPETKNMMNAIDRSLKETITKSEDLEELCHKVNYAEAVANLVLQTPKKEMNHH